MRQVNIHAAGDVRLDMAEAPAPGGGDVVVRIRACGICGSDLSAIRYGGMGGPPGKVMPLGHEAAGDVIAVGADVEGAFVGQRVVVNPMLSPGLIGSGGPEGALTEELLVRGARMGDSLHAIPDGLPYDIAALTEPLAVALHGVNQAGAVPGEKIVVFGCGPIGLGLVLWLIDRGVTDVVAIDLADERLERATALGARAVINAAREDVRARLAELHGSGELFRRPTVGTDAFLDAAGGRNILSDVLRMARNGARLVLMAPQREPLALDMNLLMTTELRITAALAYPTEMPEVIAALPRLRDTAAPLISHRFGFDDVLQAFDIARTPQSAKVMIEFDAVPVPAATTA